MPDKNSEVYDLGEYEIGNSVIFNNGKKDVNDYKRIFGVSEK